MSEQYQKYPRAALFGTEERMLFSTIRGREYHLLYSGVLVSSHEKTLDSHALSSTLGLLFLTRFAVPASALVLLLIVCLCCVSHVSAILHNEASTKIHLRSPVQSFSCPVAPCGWSFLRLYL